MYIVLKAFLKIDKNTCGRLELFTSKFICLFSETAHCANLYPDTDKDPADLVQAREEIARLIGTWLS